MIRLSPHIRRRGNTTLRDRRRPHASASAIAPVSRHDLMSAIGSATDR
ncbi:hypothetical protein AB0T83_18010 [Fluviibacterium sp. DFM31]|uniref:Uncharacterized protein n=1 Tax=Meridianimarinicoccus marinus TaxID=3231483 RepID=A0ABV3LAR9_9RHOB